MPGGVSAVHINLAADSDLSTRQSLSLIVSQGSKVTYTDGEGMRSNIDGLNVGSRRVERAVGLRLWRGASEGVVMLVRWVLARLVAVGLVLASVLTVRVLKPASYLG